MANERERLRACFAAVFPSLKPDEIERASPNSVANWESMTTVTLVAVIEEEFGVALPVEEFTEAISFELLLLALEQDRG